MSSPRKEQLLGRFGESLGVPLAMAVGGAIDIDGIPSELLRALAPRIHASTRYARLAKADAVLICVPTPLTPNREPDLGPLIDSSRALAEVLHAGQLVVLESTTYPGTTRDRVVPILEESGLAAGRDFHLAFSPERVDPGRTDFTLRNTPKVIGGLTHACTERAEATYGLVCENLVRVSTPEAAELTKLLENIFRSVNIALVSVAVLGVSYKPGVGDIRESPALKIVSLLTAAGAEVRYHDPHVPALPDHNLSSLPLDDALDDADLTIIVTAYPGIDHDHIARDARLLLDLRGVTRGTHAENLLRL